MHKLLAALFVDRRIRADAEIVLFDNFYYRGCHSFRCALYPALNLMPYNCGLCSINPIRTGSCNRRLVLSAACLDSRLPS